ncbi:hypothetical protein [Micromonospora thermarum]|uniref:Uncharacterized protein n=1 Tax=Micromonospora thermarum TaxID=2720024 RepID=A0ABX0ZF37_9ACTN|nr:hypothetical protein [Micromonospora thermarum]NJP34921.1 hypothetical protein [Micromonospora thermarum]
MGNRSLAAALVAVVLLGVAGCGGDTEPDAGQVTASASSSSPAAPVQPAPGDHTLTVDGRPGGYELHAPPGYQPGRKLPLVVAVHYRGADPAMMRRMTRLNAKADAETSWSRTRAAAATRTSASSARWWSTWSRPGAPIPPGSTPPACRRAPR